MLMSLLYYLCLHTQDPRVKEIVETTITVIFECDKNPWNKLMPEQQKVMRCASIHAHD